MKLQLRQNIAHEVSLLPLEEIEIDTSADLDDHHFSYGCSFSDSNEENSFFITFNIKLQIAQSNILAIEYHSFFEVDETITEEFKSSAFPEVNAPAIAYPYLRAFISTFLLNAGYEPIMLPSVNFAAMFEQRKQVAD